MASTTLRKLRSTLSGSSSPNPAQVIESVFQAIEQDFDIFHIFEAAEAISAREAVSISTAALTGTIDINDGTKTLSGTGTAFTTELQEGNKIELSGSIFTIESITSNTAATVQETNNTGSNISDSSPLLLTVILADRQDDGTYAKHCIGFAVEDTANGALCRIKSYGIMEGFSGLTAQEPYIVSDTAGAIVRLSQTAWSFNYQKVGYALTSNLFFISLESPQVQAQNNYLVYDASTYWSTTVDSAGAITWAATAGVGSQPDYEIDTTGGATNGNFIVNSNQLFVDGSLGAVAIGTTSIDANVLLQIGAGHIQLENQRAVRGKQTGGGIVSMLSIDGSDNTLFRSPSGTKHLFQNGTSDCVSFDIAGLKMSNDRLIFRDVNSGITASTTQTQGNGALTAEVNEVSTVANANDTVTLISAVAGAKQTVINNGANILQIFPASGDDLGAGVNLSTTLATGSVAVFQAFDNTNWSQLI